MAPVLLNPHRFGTVAPLTLAAEILADSPAFYYPLNHSGGLTATDASPNGRNGTMTGGAWVADPGAPGPDNLVWAQDGSSGSYGQTLGFTTNYVGAVTLAAWVKPAASLGSNDNPTILAKNSYHAATNTDFPIKLVASRNNTEKKFCFSLDSGGDFSTNTEIVAPTAWTADIWYHVVGVFQNGTSRLYINGVEVANATTAFNLSTTIRPWLLGTQIDNGAGSAKSRFNGMLAHVAVFPSALSAARILAHYNAGL